VLQKTVFAPVKASRFRTFWTWLKQAIARWMAKDSEVDDEMWKW
jgi:hypothetical protein